MLKISPKFILIILSILYIIYWLAISPIQYNGDSETYLGLAHMFLGKPPAGAPALFRAPGYPLLLILSGAVIPGSFLPLIFIQSIFGVLISIIIYKILEPYDKKNAVILTLTCLLSGVYVIHINQIMTEELFMVLLFYGIYLTIEILKVHQPPKKLYILLGVTFAALNTTRPFAWLFFWPLLLIIIINCFKNKTLKSQKKHIFISAISFSMLMLILTLISDITHSFGGYYSPLVTIKVQKDNFKNIYLYQIPFNEALFDNWHQQILNPNKKINSFKNKPELEKLAQQTAPIFDAPIEEVFLRPTYQNVNLIHQFLKTQYSDNERFIIMKKIAHESNKDWPWRWFNLIKNNPLILMTGPKQYSGENKFLVVYSSLQHYQKQSEKKSLISVNNGPSSKQLFNFLDMAIDNIPLIWFSNHKMWDNNKNHKEFLYEELLNHPSVNYEWDITFLLWYLMGYYNANDLLNHVSIETLKNHPKSFIFRVWDNILKVAFGPGYVEIDTLYPHFGHIEIYNFLTTKLLSPKQIVELENTKDRYQSSFINKQKFIQWSYFFFYLLKPIFLFLSLIGICMLILQKKSIMIPLVLLLPHLVCIIIYGTLFTALPRYTDPTILLPFMVCYITFWEVISKRKNKDIK